jgi:signal peptidase I
MKIGDELKKFWRFIWHGDSIWSYIAFFAFAIVVLNVVYPIIISVLSLTIGINDIVAVISGSMVHDASISETHYAYLQNIGISAEEIASFPYNNGLNPGDLMLVWKREPEDIRVGDVIVFKKGDYLVIHRVIQIVNANGEYYYTTKGDHNPGSLPSEINITYDYVKGVANNRVPFLGIPKMLLTNFLSAVQNVL